LPFRRRPQIVLLVLIAGIWLTGLAMAQVKSSSAAPGDKASSVQNSSVAGKLRAIVDAGRLGELRWPSFSNYQTQLVSFYRPSGYQRAWVRNGEPTAQALELVRILQQADGEGLRAEDYDASRWADRLALLRGPHEEAEEARFEVALTVSIMRYLSDLHVGRINPQHVGFEFDVSQKKLDLPYFVRQRLVSGSRLQAEVAALEPSFPGYQRLRDALQHYMRLAKRDDGEKLPDPGQLSPGGQYAGVQRLARLLRLLGDLPEGVTIPPDSKAYEGALVDAVKHFQIRHDLRPTGGLDVDTLYELNVPLSQRVQQMCLGLERYRWLSYDAKKPAIVVNIPEYRLFAFNEGSQLALTMKANVGDDYDFQTPTFEKNMVYLVFRPYWYPPPNIVRREILPELAEDRSLEDNDMELVSADGKVTSSGTLTSTMLAQVRAGKLTLRQPPGPDNALGLVKFIFPNAHHVYIHDTPESIHMFSEEGRTFSHGCIHAQEPARLAAWVLGRSPGWDLERVEYAMQKGPDNVRVNFASPIPVLIIYQTLVIAENGEVEIFEDIYQHDAKLEVELSKGYPYQPRGKAATGGGE
jgi:L,D-transpeptidase YcbB